MPDSFSDTQLGKRVVSQSGVEIGTVTDVRDGSLYVEVGVGDANETVEQLGWVGVVNQAVHRLHGRFISDISEETIRLRV